MLICERIMPSSIRFVIIPVVLLIIIPIETRGSENQSANGLAEVSKQVIAPEAWRRLAGGVCRNFGRPVCAHSSLIHRFIAPEARRRLAGGETTGTEPIEIPSPGGATDRNRSAAPPGLDDLGPRYRWFHHRLISRVPPGQRTIPDLCRNFCRPVCAHSSLTHRFIAPEARRRLAGGETTGTEPIEIPSPGGATDRNRSAAPPGLDDLGPRYRWFHHRLISRVPPERKSWWFHHRLISRVPPGQRTIPDLCRNFCRPVCAHSSLTHRFIAPEARRRLAGGETTGTEPIEIPSPGGATDRNRSAAPPGLDDLGPRYRWFHHRLISRVPPGQRTIPDLRRNIGRPPETRRYEESRVSMGCVYTIVAYGHDLEPLREAAAAALDEVDRIDRLMSHYKTDSELSRVNREAAERPIEIDPELYDFIAECLRYSRESDGAFDITVGSLMKAWGFFRGEGRMPTEAELTEARNRVGYQHVILNQKDRTIFFDKAGVELDLGGIAKGYAVDRAVTVLKRHGVRSALVSSGGSTIFGLGAPPGKTAWSIEIQDPVERDRVATTVRLKDQSLSVSGSNEKFFELDGVRYSHLMDPRSGRPVQGMLSVAVITSDGTSGDALDNVFYTLGVERSGARLKKFPASEVFFFLPESGKRWKMVHIKRGARVEQTK